MPFAYSTSFHLHTAQHIVSFEVPSFLKRVSFTHDMTSMLFAYLTYGVATIRRLLKIIGLFCRILSLLQGSFAKETYNFKEPTNRSHPIAQTHNLYTSYGVATVSTTVSRIDKIIGLFCRILSLLEGSFAKETFNFIDPTNQSHPIWMRHVSIILSCLWE